MIESRRTQAAGLALWTLAMLLLVRPVEAKELGTKKALRFAAEMAERGNWREAQYRWQGLADRGVNDASVLNNLAVAAEAMGEFERALAYYGDALRSSQGDPRVLGNQRRAVRLQRELMERAGDAPREERDADEDASAIVTSWDRNSNGKKSELGKPVTVPVRIPIPPRISLEGFETVLVASFLTEQTVMLDVNRELARFLRTELGKETDLAVLDVVPPPAIPEQRPDELVRNHEFWKYLAREHGADLIVSGVVEYSRADVSGFQEVDVISRTTGHKVRQTQFVEQEEFAYVLDLFFIDGATGTLLYRDRLRRNVIFRGLMNDPIHAFYELSESIAEDVMSTLVTRMRTESRTIFKR